MRTAIEAQAAAISELQARVELERLVSRNSGNSSFPPSMDAQPGRNGPRRGGNAATASGGRKQPGAPGAHLAWRDQPDERVAVQPAGGAAAARTWAWDLVRGQPSAG